MMESWKKQRKVLAAFGVFLVFMCFCTLVSRVIYASKLPQVSVETPRRMALDHTVTADGIVHQGREYAVTALSGLRVRTVYANIGDRVTPETLLFDLDLEDLKEKIQEKELEVKKCELQIAALEQNRSLEAQKQQTENDRAREDYARAEQRTGETAARAREALEDAEDAYESHKDHPVQMTSKEERERQQEAYETWRKENERLQKEAEEARRAYEEIMKKEKEAETPQEAPEALPDQAEPETGTDPIESLEETEARKRYEAAKLAYEEHSQNPVPEPDFSAEDAAKAAWEEKKKSLKDAVSAAEDAAEDAEQTRSDTLLDAGRKVSDADLPDNADNSLAVSRLELNVLKNELAAYRKVYDASGQVYPEAEGIITRIQVSPGERVGDGAAAVYADLSSPMQFQVSLTKEQKKYVNQGDTAKLTLGNSSGQEVTVDYIAENESNPELYDVRVFLPDGVGTIGQSGSFRVEAQSETYACCIPLSALHEDSSKRNFVYIVSPRAGILGTELTAEKVYVRILDQNDRYAAIEEGVIDRESELIVNSTEELKDWDVVRYKE